MIRYSVSHSSNHCKLTAPTLACRRSQFNGAVLLTAVAHVVVQKAKKQMGPLTQGRLSPQDDGAVFSLTAFSMCVTMYENVGIKTFPYRHFSINLSSSPPTASFPAIPFIPSLLLTQTNPYSSLLLLPCLSRGPGLCP